jgi:GTP cyclohydrolase I
VKIKIAYIPNGKIVGLSKILRVVEVFSRRMMMRGVQKQNVTTTTSGFRGAFKETDTRNELLSLLLQV